MKAPVFVHRPKGVRTYFNSEVRYSNYLPTPQVYNTNVVDKSHVVMHDSSSHVNMYNSYSNTDMSRWSNHNAYIF
jgi:hypothetical protein